MNYASIVPLIGGETLAMENIFGKRHLFGAKVLAMSIDPEIPEFYNSNDTLKYVKTITKN